MKTVREAMRVGEAKTLPSQSLNLIEQNGITFFANSAKTVMDD